MGIDRTKKVKEARDEAKKEIDDYRKDKDNEFKKFESEVRTSLHLNQPSKSQLTSTQHTSGNKKAQEDANKDAESQMKDIKGQGSKGQDQVVKDLLKAVFDIKPVVPDRIEVPK